MLTDHFVAWLDEVVGAASGFGTALRYIGWSIANRAADARDHPTGMRGFPRRNHGHALHLAGRKADEGPRDRTYRVASGAGSKTRDRQTPKFSRYHNVHKVSSETTISADLSSACGEREFPLVKARGLTQQKPGLFHNARGHSLRLPSCRADILRLLGRHRRSAWPR
jgi:hypothetical protein